MGWPWLAAIAAVTSEAWFRLSPWGPGWMGWLVVAPLGVVVSLGVWRTMQQADSLIAGFVLYSTATLLLRVPVSLILLGERPSWRTWAALSLALAAKMIV